MFDLKILYQGLGLLCILLAVVAAFGVFGTIDVKAPWWVTVVCGVLVPAFLVASIFLIAAGAAAPMRIYE